MILHNNELIRPLYNVSKLFLFKNINNILTCAFYFSNHSLNFGFNCLLVWKNYTFRKQIILLNYFKSQDYSLFFFQLKSPVSKHSQIIKKKNHKQSLKFQFHIITQEKKKVLELNWNRNKIQPMMMPNCTHPYSTLSKLL